MKDHRVTAASVSAAQTEIGGLSLFPHKERKEFLESKDETEIKLAETSPSNMLV